MNPQTNFDTHFLELQKQIKNGVEEHLLLRGQFWNKFWVSIKNDASDKRKPVYIDYVDTWLTTIFKSDNIVLKTVITNKLTQLGCYNNVVGGVRYA